MEEKSQDDAVELQVMLDLLENAGYERRAANVGFGGEQRYLYCHGPFCIWIEWDPQTGIEFAAGSFVGHTLEDLRRLIAADVKRAKVTADVD